MIGTEIGCYKIVDQIGDGGMGVVYKAIDTQLDRVVAVKALNPELSGNPALVERFRIEARAQAQLNHPNLATLYTFLVQDGAAYMVMEFVDGETFHRMIARRGPIPAEESVPLFRQALAGIGHAHRMGIVHRDIKPSNVMLNRDGVVKVMDFGLAKVAGSHSLTRTGVRMGSAYYMSPEQVLVKPVDVRSDIYSLGVTLYEMLTGQVPFEASSEFEVLNNHVNTPPPPPSRVYPQIPQAIENAVLKALAKDPAQRFQTVDQFSAELEHPAGFYLAKTLADDAPVPPHRQVTVASAPPAPAKPAFWTGRHKLLAGSGAALACLLAGWLLFHRPPAVPAPTPAKNATPTPAHPATPTQPPAAPTKQPAPVKPPEAPKFVVPEGTHISVRTVDPIDSKASRIGQEFLASVAAEVDVKGHKLFDEGDDAHLRLGQTAGSGKGKPELTLQLFSITTGGKDRPVTAGPFVMKSGFLRKKKVDAGTRIEFITVPPS